MKVFCHYIREAILEMFHLNVDVYVSRKKGLVNFALKKPLSSYSNSDYFILFISDEWRKRKISFTNHEMVYPMLISSLKWKYDCFFKTGYQKMTDQNILEKLCNKIVDVVHETFIRKYYFVKISRSKLGQIF